MKYLSLLFALAIVYFAASQMGATSKSVKSSIAEAQEEAAKVNPQATPIPKSGQSAGAPSLSAPIQQAEELQKIIKQRNADANF